MGDGAAGMGMVLLPRPRECSTVESFLSAVRLVVNFVCIASQGQADTGRWIIDFHLLLIGEQVCSFFPGTSFHPHGNKCMHPFNLAPVVSTFAINCIFKATNHSLLRLGKWKATLEQILWMHRSLKIEILGFLREEGDSEWWKQHGEEVLYKSCKLEGLKIFL